MVIYFDTNVLLNFYSWPKAIVVRVLEQLEELFDDDIVVPFRAHYEFHKNRERVMKQIKNEPSLKKERNAKYKKIIDDLKTSMQKFDNLIEIKRRSSSFPRYSKEIKDVFEKNVALMESEYETSLSLIRFEFDDNDDPVREFVDNHKSSYNPTFKEQMELAIKWQARVSLNLKPGLKDIKKETTADDPFERCGDFLIWWEILQNFKKDNCCYLITDESKGDWQNDVGKEEIDAFLSNEFKEYNTNAATITTSWSSNFLYDFLKDYFEQDIEVLAFLKSNKELFDDVFIKKKYVDDYKDLLTDYYIQSQLADYLIEEYPELEDFEIEELHDIETQSELNNIKLAYTPESDTLLTILVCTIYGTCSYNEYLGHIDDDYQYNHHSSVPFEIIAELEITHCFDGSFIGVDSISAFNVKIFEYSPEDGHDDYSLDEEDCGEYGNCPDCGQPLNDDNNGGNGFCLECSKNH